MGILDLPGPLFGAVEGWMAGFAPPMLRLMLWAALAAFASIELYRLMSPQRRITAAAAELQRCQRALNGFDGEFRDALPMMARMLRAAGRRLGLVAPAAVAAALPILALLVWLDGAYGRRFPNPGEPVAVHAEPARMTARWDGAQDGRAGKIVVVDDGREVVRATLATPVATLHKRQWWNLLIGNPAGYLPSDAPVERIDIGLPRQRLLGAGPSWASGWEAPFFLSFLVFALALKRARRVM